METVRAAAVTLAIFVGGNVSGQTTFLWDGGHPAQNKWSSGQNWNPNGSPLNDGSSNLIFSGGIRLISLVDNPWSINSLTFADTEGATAGSFQITGATLTLAGAGLGAGIVNQTTLTQQIDNAIELGGSQAWSATSGDLIFNGGIDLDIFELTLGGAHDTLASGVIAGSGNLLKAGSGTLTLTGANTYTGTTTINGGRLVGTTTSLVGDITNNAELVFDQATDATYARIVTGTGIFTKQGAGALTVTNVQAYEGATNIDVGALILGAGGGLDAGTAVTVASGATFALAAGNIEVGSIAGSGSITLGAFNLTSGGAGTSTMFDGVIAGSGGLSKVGSGTLELFGANTYTGGTIIDAGTIRGRTTSLQGDFDIAGTLIFDQSFDGTFAGQITGTGLVRLSGSGEITLTGSQAATGGTEIAAGRLTLGAVDALGDTSLVTILGGATLRLNVGNETVGAATGGGNIELGAFTLTSGGSGASTTLSGVISGTGGLVKEGAGTMILAGANTYTGGTAVNAGTLQGTTASLQGNIANTATVVFDQTSTGTYGGVMSGTGALVKAGSGTLTLAGSNTYTGGTAINAGALQGSTSSLQGSIVNDASLIFDQSGTGTFAGQISGTGIVTKAGAGTVVLSGANTYSGGTIISDGILQGTTTSLQGNVANSGALVFDQDTTGTFAGAISGAGSLLKQGTGTVVLGGANTYSGGTTIAAGTLQGSTTSLQGNIANSGIVVFDQAVTGTHAGVISGSGSVSKQNAGTLVLTGANTYAGGTTVAAGTLQGTATSLQGNIVNQGSVVFDQSANGTFTGVISGNGSVTKQGAGSLIISGANTFTGPTTVNAGTLALGAGNALSAASNLTLNAATTLDLAGYSSQVGVLGYNTAVIDFGLAATTNYFLFAGGTPSSGTLTINNYSSGDGDIFAFSSGASGVDATFINGVYFYGIGGGSVTATNQTLSGYGGTWDFITPNTTAFFTWDGGGPNSNWGSAANWSTDVAPPSGSSLKLSFDGTTQLAPTMNGSYTANTVRFNTNAGAFTLSASGSNSLTLAGAVPSIMQLSANAQTIQMPVILGANMVIETTGSGTLSPPAEDGRLTISGVISGSGGFNKVGDRELILAGTNTYAGATTITAGTVVLQNSSALGATTAGTTVVAGATLQLANGVSVGAEGLVLNGSLRSDVGANSFAGAISGSGSVAVNGGGLTLAGTTANSYTGSSVVNSGTLTLAKTGGVTAIAGNITVGNGSGTATLALGANEQIGNAGSVTLAAGGTPVFNLAARTETIGSLASANPNAIVQLGTGGSLLTGGNNASTAFAGVIADAGALTKQGTGAFTLYGTNTYSGATTVTAGTLVLRNSAALGATGTGTTVSVGANLQLENSITVGAESLLLNGTLINAADTNAYGGAISGSGAININGGTLALTGAGANSFTGLTRVNSGTLDLNKSTNVTAVSGNLVIGDGAGTDTVRLLAAGQIADSAAVTLSTGGAPVLDLNGFTERIGSLASTNSGATVQLGAGTLLAGASNANTTFAGSITGTGAFTKEGTGTLTLTGTNTYEGGTTISAGALLGNTTSLQRNVTNNGTIIFDQAVLGTFTGNISGAGSFTKQNAGTLILTGTNTYGGGTTLTGGILQGSTTSLQGDIINNAALNFDQASTGAFAGAISGTGSLTKLNAGTLILTGANTYSGGTTVSAGVLQGTSGSLQGNIVNQGAVVFDQTTTGAYAGIISGTGSVTKQNSGTLVLTGPNTYAGGTTVSGGVLQGDTSSLQGTITNHATVVFDQAVDGTFAGTIGGSGALTKANSGTLTLTAPNTYSGGTTLSGGSLLLGSSNLLADSGALTLGASTTLDLNSSSSERVGLLNFNSSTIDFGVTAGANYFLFSDGGTATGTLTIDNWNATTDVFGVSTNTLSQSFLDSVYFAGLNVGIGAVISPGPVSVGGYGNFYTLAPIPTFIWDGGHTGGIAEDTNWWSKKNNWEGNIAPGVGAIKAIVMAGTTQLETDMNEAFQIKSLLFRSDAGAFRITSSTTDTLTIGGGGINNQSASAQSIEVAIALSASQTWTASAGNLTFDGTVLNGAHTLTVTGNADTTINGMIGGGTGGLVKDGAGVLELTAANSFTGGVVLNAGTVKVASDANLGAVGGGLSFNGGTLATTAGISSARAITLAAGGGTIDTGALDSSLSGVISGVGGLNKNGSGSLTLAGANSYSGGTAINAGSLTAGASNVLSNQTAVSVATGATFNLANFNQSVGSIAGDGNVALGSATLSAGGNNSSTTFGGVLSGTGAFTKTGSGALTLTGANTYTGATTVTAGTLILGAANTLHGSTSLTIANGAAVTVNAGVTNAIAGLDTAAGSSITLAAGATLAINNASASNLLGDIFGSGTLSVTGGGNLTLGSNFDFENGTLIFGGTTVGGTPSSTLYLGNNPNIGTLRITGDTILDFGDSTASVLTTANFEIDAGVKISINNWVEWQDYFFAADWAGVVQDVPDSGPAADVDFNGWSTPTTWKSWDNQITPTPEPETYGLMIISALGAAFGWWRRRMAAPAS